MRRIPPWIVCNSAEAVGRTVDGGDLKKTRAIWADELSAMLFNQQEIDAVTRALDAGDLDALRQMFSERPELGVDSAYGGGQRGARCRS